MNCRVSLSFLGFVGGKIFVRVFEEQQEGFYLVAFAICLRLYFGEVKLRIQFFLGGGR